MNDPEIPHGWTWLPLQDSAVLVQYGTSAKTSDDRTGIPIVRMGNIVDGELQLDDLKYLPSSHDEFPDLFLKPGDLLFNRTNSPELVGKCAVYQSDHPQPCSFASYLIRVRFRDYEPSLAAAFINSPHGREWARAAVSQQVGQANISGGKLRALLLPTPPLSEQRRIVAKLDTLRMHSRRSKQAIDAIGSTIRRGVEAFARGATLRPLGEVLTERGELAGNRWESFMPVGLSNSGTIERRREKIGTKTAHKCQVVYPGDIVFNPIRLSIGSIARYRGSVPALVSPEYVVVVPSAAISGEYLVHFLRSPLGRSLLENESQGSVRYRVYFSTLAKISIPLGSADAQRSLETVLAAAATASVRTNEASVLLNKLNAAVLAAAFRGELLAP